MFNCYHRHRPDLQVWFDRGQHAGQEHPHGDAEELMCAVLLDTDEDFTAEIATAVTDGIRVGQRQPVTVV